ncbi:UNVERIFIED_CONTAM: hypothetical protein Sradi_6819700 [Sesamum radiatum]|uniref:Uncharacterized protein n=1 Tax=Sesamum radiatum TaxID=300843 RepID=A0AAW2JSQ3_SESRA
MTAVANNMLGFARVSFASAVRVGGENANEDCGPSCGFQPPTGQPADPFAAVDDHDQRWRRQWL